jgi:Ni/Co efflux regulator RcnB
MKRILAIATALCFALPSMAFSAPGDKDKSPHGKPPMTKPAFGAKPVGKPKPPENGHKPKPPGNGHKPRPPHHKPPKPRPPSWRPPNWHKPRPSQWYWRGKWIGRIRGPVYHYPTGYAYRYWGVGDRLPALFLAAQFFYDNVAPLGLEVPPPGYRWVRYGPDLLLVNLHTGSVEQVAYGVFY